MSATTASRGRPWGFAPIPARLDQPSGTPPPCSFGPWARTWTCAPDRSRTACAACSPYAPRANSSRNSDAEAYSDPRVIVQSASAVPFPRLHPDGADAGRGGSRLAPEPGGAGGAGGRQPAHVPVSLGQARGLRATGHGSVALRNSSRLVYPSPSRSSFPSGVLGSSPCARSQASSMPSKSSSG